MSGASEWCDFIAAGRHKTGSHPAYLLIGYRIHCFCDPECIARWHEDRLARITADFNAELRYQP